MAGGSVVADYAVVGAGATGMAFTDAVVSHGDATVALVDTRHAPGGHWLDAYPFVRLHQASVWYGVDSVLLGDGRIQDSGPERGLQERATAPEICGYYAKVLDSLVGSGRVRFLPSCRVENGTIRSLVSGREWDLRATTVVDARYLSPDIPAATPPPFEVADGVAVVPVNELAQLGRAPEHYTIVGAGKTSMDAVVWLLDNEVPAEAITWIRPRDPWLLNRSYLQPGPSFLAMVATTMEALAGSDSLEEVFSTLERAGVMRRLDPDVRPTMAKTPTVADWEVDRLRRVRDVVRMGHVRRIEPHRIVLERGTVATTPGTLHVHCAAPGLKYPPLVPIFGAGTITLQPTRAGFPCYGAAHAGFVAATRTDLAEANRLCPATPFGDSLRQWAVMWALGGRADRAMRDAPDVRAWSDGSRLNPARLTAAEAATPAVRADRERFQVHAGPALERLVEWAGLS